MTTPETLTLNLKLNPELSSQTKELVSLAEFYVVNTAEESVEASEFLARIQKLRRWIDGIYKDAKAPLSTAKRVLDSQQKALLDPLAQAESSLIQRIVAFTELQNRERQERETVARLDAQAVAQAEQERQAESIRTLANANKTSPAAAVALHAQADMIEQAAPLIMPVPVVMDATLSTGMQRRTSYGANVESLRALVMGVAAQIIVTEYAISDATRTFLVETFRPTPQCSLSLIEAVLPKINLLARALKNDLLIPGVTLQKQVTLIAK